MKTKVATLALFISSVLILPGCVHTPAVKPDALALLSPASGSAVNGRVSFNATASGLRLEVSASGLTAGEHGFHIHEVGDCSAADATSAKGHFNPAAQRHGSHASGEHHAGDIPNLVAAADGTAKMSFELSGLDLTGERGILNRAVVIHADADDYKTQPAGNSGKRIACGVIKSE